MCPGSFKCFPPGRGAPPARQPCALTPPQLQAKRLARPVPDMRCAAVFWSRLDALQAIAFSARPSAASAAGSVAGAGATPSLAPTCPYRTKDTGARRRSSGARGMPGNAPGRGRTRSPSCGSPRRAKPASLPLLVRPCLARPSRQAKNLSALTSQSLKVSKCLGGMREAKTIY